MTSPSDHIADCLKLSRPARQALAAAGIATFADLARRNRKDVMALHGIGPKSFTELDPALAERGLDYSAT